MFIRDWDTLPSEFRNLEVKKYFEVLNKKKFDLILKRIMDIFLSLILLIILSLVFVIIGLMIKFSSNGPIIFNQKRITQYGRKFNIFKFRTMIVNAESLGSQITGHNDSRITKIGKFLRKYRLDELPQLINILKGDMTFVGTRPEVVKYVKHYSDEMKATLLLPAGITSEASILFTDEEILLKDSKNIDNTYLQKVLPIKMEINLRALRDFSFINDIKTLVKTLTVFLS